MKIGTRIIIFFLISFLVIIGIVSLVVGQYSTSFLKKQIGSYLFSNGRARAEHIRTFLQDQKKTGAILAAASVYRDFLKEPITSSQYKIIKDKIYSRFKRTIEVDKTIEEIFIIDKNGILIASSDKTQEGKNKATDPYFINAKKNTYIKSSYYSKVVKKNSYTVSAPILDDNDVLLGVSVLRYAPSNFYSLVQNESVLGQSEEYFLIDKNHYFLTPSKFLGDSVVLTKKVMTVNSNDCYDKIEVANIIRNGGYRSLGIITVEAKDYRNVDVVATHFFIPETEWCLINKIDRSELFFINSQLVNILLLSLVGSILLFVIVSSIISRSIVSPINKLQEGIKIIEKGNLDYQIQTKSTDEIGNLSKSFNNMTLAIKESQLSVTQKVEKQTSEIVNKNKDMEEQQSAILNILEDVENEKNKVGLLAQDLEKFKLAVANASDHIVITDPDGVVLYANRAVKSITGFDNKKIIGQKAGTSHLWGGLMPKAVYKKFWNTIKNEKKIFIGEFNNRRANGENYIAEAHVSPVLSKDNNVLFFIGIERDITKAKDVDRMKTEFISLASHQLRTPLSAMKWFTEMLLAGDMGKLNKEQAEAVDNIEQSNNRMIDLVNSLLNISRIESGRIIVDPRPTNIGDLAKDVIKILDNKIVEKKITLTISVHPNLPLINLDSKLIREVYTNLLTNAIKYTPSGGEINIFISKKSDNIISQVQDSGYGIPVDQQSKIFTKFFRADNAIKYETDGNGLGLYLIKSIIESSKGKIWFKSEEDKGTTFWFSLPISGMIAKEGEVAIT